MKTLLPNKINNVNDAKALLTDLFENKEHFHPEDDANNLVGDPFCKIEGDFLNDLMAQIFKLNDFDPCDYFLKLIEAKQVTVIRHGLLYVMGINLAVGSAFRWSSNLSEAWHLSDKDIEWFNKKGYRHYQLENIIIHD